jgi:hypothetical protein
MSAVVTIEVAPSLALSYQQSAFSKNERRLFDDIVIQILDVPQSGGLRAREKLLNRQDAKNAERKYTKDESGQHLTICLARIGLKTLSPRGVMKKELRNMSLTIH